MGYRAELEGTAALRVAIEFTAAARSLAVSWAPDTASGARCKKLEYARIFLVALGTEPQRTYLDIVDRHPATLLHLPEALPAGEYAIEIDAYGSASWGDGRLDARGRSASFAVV
ncbi:hypothetical protein [Nocardia sp. NBC_01327]|uniref:hypothetical protein n=1 Tax=Nocardia sp. NBC_01327 TaxID=2903593 RepID=UPI002E13A688|nr:hypothetical protein OG326_35670 [Nocardia sp. NBC_01327]